LLHRYSERKQAETGKEGFPRPHETDEEITEDPATGYEGWSAADTIEGDYTRPPSRTDDETTKEKETRSTKKGGLATSSKKLQVWKNDISW
jgi:hypothetical protein